MRKVQTEYFEASDPGTYDMVQHSSDFMRIGSRVAGTEPLSNLRGLKIFLTTAIH